MYNEHFGFTESPFNVTPDPRFFFNNSCYEEAFATLRYGIEERKGFVVVTGEPGTGKTTLLKRLLGNLDHRVHTAWIFDPHLTFNELFRLTLTDLGLPLNPEADRLTLLGQFYDYLIDQLKKGDIVALIIDEAQNLNEEILEELRLLSNLETNTEKLIQIVLVGQPELEEKLDRDSLFQLKQRVVARYRMRPLQEGEIPAYIETRLKTVQCERQDLFDTASIGRLARYTGGVPRLINVICDNALLVAYAKGKKSVAASDIDEAARELKLADPSTDMRDTRQLEVASASEPGAKPRPEQNVRSANVRPKRRDEEFSDGWRDHRSEPDSPFYMELNWHKPQRPPRRSGVRGLLLLCLVVATALFIAVQGEPALAPMVRGYWAKLSDLAHVPRPEQEPMPPPNVASENDHNKNNDNQNTVSQVTPVPSDLQPVIPDPESKTPSPSETPMAAENENPEPLPPVKTPAKKAPLIPDNKSVAIKGHPPVVNEIDPLSERRLQIEIYKAIRDRAINGVHVSYVDDGTVYLEGRVATPRQKLAAVRATLSVPGVKGVRDRIMIDY
jgi:type II secretory pathway predicted ATPase ExeA